MTARDETDAQLVSHWIRGGDERAWRILIQRYDPLIRRVFAAVGAWGTPEAEEALQDFWWEMSRAVGRWRGQENLLSFLAAAARRRAIDALRRQIRQRKRFVPLEVMDTPSSAEKTEDRALVSELRQALERCFERLSIRERLLFFYREVEGWSVAETAKALGVAEGTVKSGLNRVKEKLRLCMSQEGWNGTEMA